MTGTVAGTCREPGRNLAGTSAAPWNTTPGRRPRPPGSGSRLAGAWRLMSYGPEASAIPPSYIGVRRFGGRARRGPGEVGRD